MPDRHAFEYAVVRIVPRIEREEFVNAGVVLFSRAAGFLGCHIGLDEQRLRALGGASAVDVAVVAAHLQGMRDVCAGKESGGPIARLPAPERFHWLVAPRSTVIQVSPVHAGVSDDPAGTLMELYQALVAA